MKKRHENAGLLIVILLSALLAAGFTAAASLPENETGVIFGVNYSLAVYVALLLLAFALFLLLRAFSWLLPGKSGPLRALPGLLLDALYTVSALALVLYIFYIYKNETNVYPEGTAADYLRQLVPHRWYYLIVIIIAALLFFTAARKNIVRRLPRRAAFGAVFALLTAFAAYSACPLFDGGAGSYHTHAVTNTIVNAARGIPFSDLNNSIYGHYALIFYPFVKLFGGGYEAIAVSLSIFTFITYAAAFFTASKLITRDDIFLYTAAAIAATSTVLSRRGQYFQIIPLRLIMPCLALAYLSFAFSKSGLRRRKLTGLLSLALGILAFIWNFETGLFAAATIAAARIFASLREHRFFSLQTLRQIVLEILYAAACFAAAFALVGIYNIACGGRFGTLRQFIYPLFSGTYSVQHLRISLPSVPCLYVFEIMLFFDAILISILRRPFAKEAETVTDDDAMPGFDMQELTLTFATGLSGLLSLIYFINRASFGNLAISTIQMAILLGVFAEECLSFPVRGGRTLLHYPASFGRAALSGVMFLVLIFAALEGTLYSGVCLLNRAQAGSWQRTGFEETEAWISDTVPEDALAAGVMLPEIYFDMGRDPHIALTDWSDMNEQNLACAENEVLSSDHVLTEASYGLAAYLDSSGYRLSASFSCGDRTFVYYEKT